MPLGRPKVSRPGSIKKMKSELKGGGDSWFFGLAADTDITVRFLTEPPDWVNYFEHFVGEGKDGKRIPCNTGDCEPCDDGNRPRKVWVAPVVDVVEKRVRVMRLPVSIVEKLVNRYEKYQTIQDRDYTISRLGSGKNDTSYDVESEGRTKMDLRKYDIPDIEKMIVNQLKEARSTEDDDDDEDEPDWAERPSRKASKKAVRKAVKSSGSKSIKKRLR